MSRRLVSHLGLILALTLGLVGSILPARTVARAKPAVLFASPTGTTLASCSRADPCDLQTAIDAAGEGVTVYAAAGTYTAGKRAQVVSISKTIQLLGGWDGDTLGSGPLVVNPTVYLSILNGENKARVVKITGGAVHITPLVDGFNIANGYVSTPGGDPVCAPFLGCGAGISISDADPTISHNQIFGNTVTPQETPLTTYLFGMGAAIYVLRSSPVIRDNVIYNNFAGYPVGAGLGGGIYFSDSGGEIAFNTIHDNHCGYSHGFTGCGLYMDVSTASVHDNTLYQNGTQAGHPAAAAAIFAAGSASFRDNLIYGHTGISISDIRGAMVSVMTNLFENNVVRSNTCADASSNAVAILQSGESLIHNNILADTCGASGRNLQVITSDPAQIVRIENNTLVKAPYALQVSGPSCNVSIFLNIFAGHMGGVIQADACDAATPIVILRNLFYESMNWLTPAALPNTLPVAGDPFFVDGIHENYHIGSRSNARNSGYGSSLTLFDIDHEPRPTANSDIGADQYRGYTWLPAVRR